MATTTTPGGVSGPKRTGSRGALASLRLGRLQLGVVGFFAYLVPGFLVFMIVKSVLEALDVATSVTMNLAVFLALPIVAAWRGATIFFTVRPDGLLVRNRWRKVLVPFGEVEAIQVQPSLLYGPIQFFTTIYMQWQGYAAFDTDQVTSSDMLVVARRGHARPMPIYATLGMGLHWDKTQPVLEALAAHGHPVDVGSPIATEPDAS